MDGSQKRLNASIQLKLSLTLVAVILVVSGVAGVFSFMAAFDEAHELQDQVLHQVADLIVRQHLSPAAAAPHLQDDGEESRVIIQSLGDGQPTGGDGMTHRPLPLPSTLPDGLQTVAVGDTTFRVLVTTTAGQRFAVAQETAFRNDVARDSALRTVIPFLILVPVLLLITVVLVRKMFRPVAALAAEIDQRGEQELHPIEDSHLPAEVRPFVVAINRLLARVAQSMAAQRRFVADAAHELRSPLTALSLQAERLEQAQMSDQGRDRLATLRQGIERSRNLLEQLLTLAKSQAAPEAPPAPVSIQSIFRLVLEDLMPLAEAKNIDIGVKGDEDAQVWVNEMDMVALVRNLVDNAIRYTPTAGTVTLALTTGQDRAILSVEDSGPGIPLAERERVFDPFYRTLGSDQAGSGLGLSIVKTVSDRIGAEIRLGCSDETSHAGLRVRVIMPLTPLVRELPWQSK